MRTEHSARIVCEFRPDPDQPTPMPWVLYCDGAYCDHFSTTRQARSALLTMCADRSETLIRISIEDAAGRRLSSERLLHSG